ncbi:MAG: DUF177 domain-containing protein [Actinobacteria bacterium]|nr:DUF177 domain-containing protein [Actinomycetota bacterium]
MPSTKRPWIVFVGPLLRAPGSRREEHVRAPVEGVAGSASEVPSDEDVAADLVLESLRGGGLVAAGSIEASWEGPCVRCLGKATGRLHVDVRELFEPGSDGEETYPLEGDQIDLEPLVRDAVLLELPLAPLCADDCQGLCPVCGVNRNTTSCTCAAEARDPRWAALDQLRAAEGGKASKD